MQKFTILRSVAPLILILALAVLTASSCNSTVNMVALISWNQVPV